MDYIVLVTGKKLKLKNLQNLLIQKNTEHNSKNNFAPAQTLYVFPECKLCSIILGRHTVFIVLKELFIRIDKRNYISNLFTQLF